MKCYLVMTDSPTGFSSATASLGRRDILLRFSSATAFSDSSFQLTGEDRHNKNRNLIILLHASSILLYLQGIGNYNIVIQC